MDRKINRRKHPPMFLLPVAITPPGYHQAHCHASSHYDPEHAGGREGGREGSNLGERQVILEDPTSMPPGEGRSRPPGKEGLAAVASEYRKPRAKPVSGREITKLNPENHQTRPRKLRCAFRRHADAGCFLGTRLFLPRHPKHPWVTNP